MLGESRAATIANLALDYGAAQRTLVFTLLYHEALLRRIWLQTRLAIRSRDGCPPVLVFGIPRSGLGAVLQHTLTLRAEQAVTSN